MGRSFGADALSNGTDTAVEAIHQFYDDEATHIFPMKPDIGMDLIENTLYKENVYGQLLGSHLEDVMRIMSASMVLANANEDPYQWLRSGMLDDYPHKDPEETSADKFRLKAVQSCSSASGNCKEAFEVMLTDRGICNVFNGHGLTSIFETR